MKSIHEKVFCSWDLFKASGKALSRDKLLIVFPFCALLASVALIACFGFFAQFVFMNAFHLATPALLISWFLFALLYYWSQYFIITFCNAALIGTVLNKLNNGKASIGDGFADAFSIIGKVFAYSVLASTVWGVFSIIAGRSELKGRATIWALDATFAAATFLVLPILVSRKIGILGAIRESAALLSKSWGENVVVNMGMGIIFFFICVLLMAVGVGMAFLLSPMAHVDLLLPAVISLMGGMFLLTALVYSSLKGIYMVVLYGYAHDGMERNGFSKELLESAFACSQVEKSNRWARGKI